MSDQHWEGFSLKELLENLDQELPKLSDDERRALNRKIHHLQRLVKTKISEAVTSNSRIQSILSGKGELSSEIENEIRSFIIGMVAASLFSENRMLALAALTLSEVARMEGIAHLVDNGISMKLSDGSPDTEAEKLWLGDCVCPACKDRRDKIDSGDTSRKEKKIGKFSNIQGVIENMLGSDGIDDADVKFVSIDPDTGEASVVTGETAKLYADRVLNGKNPFTGEDSDENTGLVIGPASTTSESTVQEIAKKIEEMISSSGDIAGKPPTPTKH